MCLAAIGLTGDICRSLGAKVLPYCNEIMMMLLENLGVRGPAPQTPRHATPTSHSVCTHRRENLVVGSHLDEVFLTIESTQAGSVRESGRFSQPIVCLAEPIDDRLHNRFVRRHFENLRTSTVGPGDIIGDNYRSHFIKCRRRFVSPTLWRLCWWFLILDLSWGKTKKIWWICFD